MTREELLEKRRAGFEEAYLDQFHRPPDKFCPVISKYINAHAQGAWWAWNAALDSVVIELPSALQIDDEWDSCKVGFNQGVEECIEIIQQQGYKVKP